MSSRHAHWQKLHQWLAFHGWRWDVFGVQLQTVQDQSHRSYGPILGTAWGDFDREFYSDHERSLFVNLLLERFEATFGKTALPEKIGEKKKRHFEAFVRSFEQQWNRTLAEYRASRTPVDKMVGWLGKLLS